MIAGAEVDMNVIRQKYFSIYCGPKCDWNGEWLGNFPWRASRRSEYTPWTKRDSILIILVCGHVKLEGRNCKLYK